MADDKVARKPKPRNDITAEEVRATLNYDPESGMFTWRKHRPPRGRIGKSAGCYRPDGYLVISFRGIGYMAHRLAWLWMTGEWPQHQIDHMNQRRSDLSWGNLRAASHSDNLCNQRRQANNRSGYKGVYFKPDCGRRPWNAQIAKNRIRHNLGNFATAEAAHAAYCKAAAELHGAFARFE